MTLQMAVDAADGVEPILGEEAFFSQCGIDNRAGMAFGENEAVAILPMGILGINLHNIKVECGDYIGAGQCGCRVRRPLCLVCDFYNIAANGICHQIEFADGIIHG